MGSQPSDQQYFPDFGKKGSQNGLTPNESPKHRLKCQNARLGWVSEVFMPRFIPKLHLSAEIQHFSVSKPSKPVIQVVAQAKPQDCLNTGFEDLKTEKCCENNEH